MKILGLKICEPKAQCLNVVKPLHLAQRHPDVVAKHVEGMRKRDNSTDSDGSRETMLREQIPWTVENLRDEVEEMGPMPCPESELKFRLVELAIRDIDMGRYQWQLFALCGSGWACDNLWIQGVALILPSLSSEFGISAQLVRYATCALYVGCCIGAAGWGMVSDVLGRRLAFNLTLLITGSFGIALGGAKSFVTICGLLGALGYGLGGNLPVDGTMFLEFLPQDHRDLLTLLSIWWPIGQVIASLLGWYFMATKYPVNIGWRYFLYCMGGITAAMAMARLFFDTIESPKYHLGQNHQDEAVRAVRNLAHRNKKTTWLTVELLDEIGGRSEEHAEVKLSTWRKIRREVAAFGPDKISPLFGTWLLGVNTGLLWFGWICIGMGYPMFNSFLPQYLSNGHTSENEPISKQTYRDYVIISAVAVPGSIFACLIVDRAGRKIPMALATMITGVFFFCFTISQERAFQLGFSCVASFFQNIMFGVLYAYTPETFPGPCRGTGTGIAHSLSRVGALSAPLLAANIPATNPNVPVFVSGALILAAFVALSFLRIETKNRQTL